MKQGAGMIKEAIVGSPKKGDDTEDITAKDLFSDFDKLGSSS